MKKSIKKAVKIIKEEGFISLLTRILRRIERIIFSINLKNKIRSLNKYYSVESLVDFVFSTSKSLIKPFQFKSEILGLLKILKRHKPKYILEIGTASGGTLFLFSRIAADDAVIISLDLQGGKFGGGYPKWKIPLYKSFSWSKQKIILIRANSHEKNSLMKIKHILKGKNLDLIYIDGDHSYEGVKKDFEFYSPLLSNKCGIIAFHDIVNIKLEDVGVHRFWDEIKVNYEYEEIVKDWNQKWGGIGILKGKINGYSSILNERIK